MIVGQAALLALAFAGGSDQAVTSEAERLRAALAPRRVTASRLEGARSSIVIDGRLDEPEWAQAEAATDLVQRRPVPGALSTLGTEARVLYDDQALYVGVRLLDPRPDTITAPYPRRDDEITSDWVFVEIDSRHDRRTGFSFGVNPRGVQCDGAWFDDTSYDGAWNAVWESAARITAEGWEAEFRIPFSQLAYVAEEPAPDGSSLAAFGINIYRHNPHGGETSNWSPRLPSQAGIVSNFNDLLLRLPPRRARVELLPFASATASPGRESVSGGLDVRAGVGPAFTLTAALHPDFGQVEADPSEVNLTTFETLFTERRPLFVENAGLFSFDLGLPLTTRGNSLAAEQAFYSRRIGRPPRLTVPEGTVPIETPDAATLLGAAKLTGRTAAGWSLGALYAVTGTETARFTDGRGVDGSLRVEPATEFLVSRVSKDFRSGRSAVGGIATVLHRSAMTPELAQVLPSDAGSAGLDARHRFDRDQYEATGFVLAGRIQGTPTAIGGVLHGPGHYTQRPDSAYLESSPPGSSASGFAAQARIAKVGGEHWRWALASRMVSPRLDLNDAGFQRNADWRIAFGSLSYQDDRPGRLLRRWAVGSNQVGLGWSFGGERRAAVVNVNASADLHNYWGGSLSFDQELPALQTEALRGGPALLMPSRQTAAFILYSDTRKTSQVTLDVRGFREPETGSHRYAFSPAASLRASDRLAVSVGPSFEQGMNAWQYLGAPVTAGRTRYIVGQIDQTTVSLTTRVDFAFSSRLTLQLYAQPFASDGLYSHYKEVVEPRAARAADRVRDIAADGIADPSYRVRDLRANLVLRWEYRPGSTAYVVWSQSRHASPIEDSPFGSARDVFDVFEVRPTNTVLAKVSYWFSPRR